MVCRNRSLNAHRIATALLGLLIVGIEIAIEIGIAIDRFGSVNHGILRDAVGSSA